jgi:N-ethylmaleimide reductase
MSASGQPLFQPVTLGDLELPNRIVMAPMTRARANNPDLAPTVLPARVRYRSKSRPGGRESRWLLMTRWRPRQLHTPPQWCL